MSMEVSGEIATEPCEAPSTAHLLELPEAPFDAIVLTAAPAAIPAPLKEQLKVGGRLVAPVGERVQQLRVLTRTVEGFASEDVTAVRFVPMTGRAQE